VNHFPGKTRILVIDDEPAAFTLVQHMLASAADLDVAIDWVDTFDAGLEAVQENQHDVYLVDFKLSDGSGVELLRCANDLGIQVPAILLTAYGNYDTDIQVMHLGAMDYLDKKHLSPELLERSIRYALERSRTEKELRRLHQQVADLEQLKTDMIRMAAHDLKNPIATILMNIHLIQELADMESDPRLARAINNIEISADSMRMITSSILSLERIQEIYARTLHNLHLNPLVTAVCREMESAAQEKGQDYMVVIAEEPLHAWGDHSLLSQAIGNLISNAIKHAPPASQIAVRLYRERDEAVLEVQDNGSGIPPEMHSRIFQPFFRVETGQAEAVNGEAEGSGLGLYLVSSVVVRHQGTIIFQSKEGEGSLFGFRLPLGPGPKTKSVGPES
jgi:signal transduction histidine kinase